MNKKIYYIGNRYLTELEHPSFGKHKINASDNSVTLPEKYADILLKDSPKLFAVEPSNYDFYAEMAKGKGGYSKLAKYAREERGLDTNELKTATDIISALQKLDVEA